MKKLFITLAAVVAFAACSDDDEPAQLPAAPTIVLQGSDIDQPIEITEEMTVKVDVKAPGTIAGFTVTIDSPALTEEILQTFGLGKELDLCNPGSMAGMLTTLGFPCGDKAVGQTDLSFDISQLVPRIAMIYHETSDHKFTLAVTDAKEQTTTKTLTFHLTAPATLTYNDDADLWANTATVTAENLPDGAKVQYRVKDGEWQDAALTEGSTYQIAPEWDATQNDAKLAIYDIKAGTGVFAGNTYEVRIAAEDGQAIGTPIEFDTRGGDTIPNGDMSGWSTISRLGLFGPAIEVAYPNASEEEAFWDCGNNGVTTTLCISTDTDSSTDKKLVGEAAPAARLGSQNMMVLAAGNLFTGSFSYANMTGTVDFGRKYPWTARPSALKLKYTAKVDEIDIVRGSGDMVKDVAKGDPDNARIFVAIVDWNAPHQVESNMSTTKGSWDPEKTDTVDEGKILGYGSFKISSPAELGDALKDLEIQIHWYDKEAKPAEGSYSLVISCACNEYGDYFTGCSTNVMYVDDFEWAY